jgi:hypothetical protein
MKVTICSQNKELDIYILKRISKNNVLAKAGDFWLPNNIEAHYLYPKDGQLHKTYKDRTGSIREKRIFPQHTGIKGQRSIRRNSFDGELIPFYLPQSLEDPNLFHSFPAICVHPDHSWVLGKYGKSRTMVNKKDSQIILDITSIKRELNICAFIYNKAMSIPGEIDYLIDKSKNPKLRLSIIDTSKMMTITRGK